MREGRDQKLDVQGSTFRKPRTSNSPSAYLSASPACLVLVFCETACYFFCLARASAMAMAIVPPGCDWLS